MILRGEGVGRRHYLICGGYNDGRFMRYLHPNLNLTLPLVSDLLFGMSSFQHKRPLSDIKERMLEDIKTSFSDLCGLASSSLIKLAKHSLSVGMSPFQDKRPPRPMLIL